MEKSIKTKVIGLYGGPCSGKSTIAARLFSDLKLLGYNCELATEYAKDATWQQSYKVLENQIYVFAQQQHRLWRLRGNVDVIITDSPLPLYIVYGTTTDTFKKLVVEEYERYTNFDIYLNRIPNRFNPKGRIHSEDESKILDKKIIDLMKVIKGKDQPFDLILDGDIKSVQQIIDFVDDGKKIF